MSSERIYYLNPKLSAVELADAIIERFNHLSALSSVCQSDDFLEFRPEHIQNCLGLQGHLVRELAELFNTFRTRALQDCS